ncbi:MAG: ABC transporter permease subunit [Spirochaetales bacterium]|nr:ABC transporter permease subunit [Spirochaetales bacterium]
MNKTLFLVDLKANWRVILFVSLVFMIYVLTSVLMYDPDSIEKLEQMFTLFPEGMLKALGFDTLGTDLNGYVAHYLYGFIAIIFPLIYIIVIANKLIAKHVDSGSMAYLLTTPVTRVKVAVTQAVFHVSGLILIFLIDIGVLVLLSSAVFPGSLKLASFLSLNFVTIMTLTVAGGIGFLFSCMCNDSRNSLAFGAGIPVAFFVFKMVSEIDAKLEGFKYLSVFSLIEIDKILADPAYGLGVGFILLGVSVLLYGAGVIIFNKKSLAI